MSTFVETENHSTEKLALVIGLHCSGGSGMQWRGLAQAVDDRYSVIAPDMYGCESIGHWHGDHVFSLADEAAPILRVIDAADKPVHLVGHSYGGCVALRIAHERPHRIASLTLYEPVAFYALRTAGQDGRTALAGIQSFAKEIDRMVSMGASTAAAARFVEYWNGPGAWETLKPRARDAAVHYIAKASLDFHACLHETTPIMAYSQFAFPVLLLQGEFATEPMRVIMRQIARAIKTPQQTIFEAGHMGPLTHANVVNAMIVGHIDAENGKSPVNGTGAARRLQTAA